MSIHHHLLAAGLAGALALAGIVSASAGPLPVGNSGLRTAVGADATEIRWRGRGIGPGVAFGLATGALVGAAVAASPYGYYGGPGYSYGTPVYAEPYAYGPSYPAYGYSGYGYGECYTDEGYGRVRPCAGQ